MNRNKLLPGEEDQGVTQGESKFDVISGIKVASGQIETIVIAVQKERITAPIDSVVGWENTGPLALQKQDGFGKSLLVVVLTSSQTHQS